MLESRSALADCEQPLHKGALGTLTKGSRNACAHFFHTACAHELLQSSGSSTQCPICRCACDGVRTVPKASDDPAAWFFCVDASGEGYLSRAEVRPPLQVFACHSPRANAKREPTPLPPDGWRALL